MTILPAVPSAAAALAAPCPVCGKPPVAALSPFCSRRCASVDLGRWLTGHYVVPGDAAPGEPDQDEQG